MLWRGEEESEDSIYNILQYSSIGDVGNVRVTIGEHWCCGGVVRGRSVGVDKRQNGTGANCGVQFKGVSVANTGYFSPCPCSCTRTRICTPNLVPKLVSGI